jgi:uncharacterized DUF497 family protein
MRFEWDEDKNQRNIEKHGVSFEQAQAIFDGFTVHAIDDRSDYGELREISIGLLDGVAVIVVVHTDRRNICRIISARRANRKERKLYDEEIQKAFDA